MHIQLADFIHWPWSRRHQIRYRGWRSGERFAIWTSPPHRSAFRTVSTIQDSQLHGWENIPRSEATSPCWVPCTRSSNDSLPRQTLWNGVRVLGRGCRKWITDGTRDRFEICVSKFFFLARTNRAEPQILATKEKAVTGVCGGWDNVFEGCGGLATRNSLNLCREIWEVNLNSKFEIVFETTGEFYVGWWWITRWDLGSDWLSVPTLAPLGALWWRSQPRQGCGITYCKAIVIDKGIVGNTASGQPCRVYF